MFGDLVIQFSVLDDQVLNRFEKLLDGVSAFTPQRAREVPKRMTQTN
jgi:hypothetical protein